MIDNYDSFSYNLYQIVGSYQSDIKVIRNDQCTIDEIKELNPSHIILSPGPGKPSESGICIEVVKKLGNQIPILGVCLGHQAICEAFGGTVSYAKQLMHGKVSEVVIGNCELFDGIPLEKIIVGRYHSLALLEDTLPKELKICGRTADGEIMAVKHELYPIFGVQFHPESILTPEGTVIIKNFLEVVA